MDELDRTRGQLGGWPRWIEWATSSAIRPGGSVKFGGWPSWIERATSSAAELDQSSLADGRAGSKARPARPSAELDQSSLADGRAGTIALFSSCPQGSFPKIVSNSLLFWLDGGTVGTLRFWNSKYSFFRITFGLIVWCDNGFLYEESGCSSESTSFQKHSFYKIGKML